MITGSRELKSVDAVLSGRDTSDGAGVKLKRMFQGETSYPRTDPFLLCDIFGSSKVEDYIMGFPWHPHRGIETVTYLWSGKVEHKDSEDHGGTIYPGDLQWMNAGSGIFHQEMPHPLDEVYRKFNPNYGFPLERVSGIQLWVNLPSSQKMSTPSYAGILAKDIPRVVNGNGAKVSIISGEFEKTEGYYRGNRITDPSYFEITLEPEAILDVGIREGYRAILITLEADFQVSDPRGARIGSFKTAILSTSGSRISMLNGSTRSTLILVSGRPLNEPVAWYGPIVMNTREQINTAFHDLENGTFVRDRNPLTV